MPIRSRRAMKNPSFYPLPTSRLANSKRRSVIVEAKRRSRPGGTISHFANLAIISLSERSRRSREAGRRFRMYGTPCASSSVCRTTQPPSLAHVPFEPHLNPSRRFNSHQPRLRRHVPHFFRLSPPRFPLYIPHPSGVRMCLPSHHFLCRSI